MFGSTEPGDKMGLVLLMIFYQAFIVIIDKAPLFHPTARDDNLEPLCTG
jgi:hypothetical protein